MKAFRFSLLLLLLVTAFVTILSPAARASDSKKNDDSTPAPSQRLLYKGVLEASKEVTLKSLTVRIWDPVRVYDPKKYAYDQVTFFLWDKANLTGPIASVKAKVVPKKYPNGKSYEEIEITFPLQIKLPTGGKAQFYVSTNDRNTEEGRYLTYDHAGYVRGRSSVVEDSGLEESPVRIEGTVCWDELWTKVK